MGIGILCVYIEVYKSMFYAYVFEICVFAQVYSVLSSESQISNFMHVVDVMGVV